MSWKPEGHWDDHPDHPHIDWVYEVSNGDTRQSYLEWVNSQLEKYPVKAETRVVRVTATCEEQFEAIVSVPADWTDEDVLDHYRYSGANGEFEAFAFEWTWGSVTKSDGTPWTAITPEGE